MVKKSQNIGDIAQECQPMLTGLQVRNYRCLEHVELPLERLTAFVGPNGSGKTSLLRAIDLVLGEAWPSLRSFRIPQDFTNFDASREIEIVVSFDPPYCHRDTVSQEHKITAIRVTCKSYKRSGKWGETGDLHVDLEPLNEKGQVPKVAVGQPQKGQKTQFSPLRVGTDLREHARILFVDHRRSLTQHLPSVRGSILGRLLQAARKDFTAQEDFKRSYDQAMDLLRTQQVKEIEKTVAETAKRMLGFLGRSRTAAVEIGFGFADPANPFNSLRLQYHDAGLAVPGEELGLGIQSAMVVGIFEAFRQWGGNFGTIVLEEPEMYLHPQAQRYFYRLLCDMSEKGQCQVIYSTHSPIFADVNRFESLQLVRRETGRNSHVTFISQDNRAQLERARNAFKLGGKFDTARNEVLFAYRALLVEGYGDRIAALMVAEKLGFDVDAEGIAIVDCGGKAGIELVVRVCRALGIPFLVLHDEDIWSVELITDTDKRKKQEQANRDEQRKNQMIKDAVGEEGSIFVLSPSLEAALNISRDANDKPRRIAESLEGIDTNQLPSELGPLFQAIHVIMEDERRNLQPK
ncbi:MAG TPA: AAA family ATPase [Alphaproteobacteria bacterium]|nr:AAA family ATPase [Alphaproteobacteria bacterium]